jgi:DmsE family decaheme c-type cytochrome
MPERAKTRFVRLSRAPLILLAAAGLAVASIAAQESPPKPAATPSPPQRTAEQVVGGKCLRCHRDVVGAFVNQPHGKSAHFMTGESAAKCETCHGDGTKHNDTSAPEDIQNAPRMAAEDVNRMCLTCHSKEHERTSFAASEHDRKGMSCISCHSTHHPKSQEKELVKATEGELCTSCHIDIRKAYYQRSTHLFRTEQRNEKISCASCHNPHGSGRERMLVGVSTNAECYTCHAERRTPMLWEHAPVRESCLNCHVAHGSNNLSLLKARSSLLCQQCHIHMLWRHQTIAGFDAFSYNRGCVNCHQQIHGSNHPSGRTFTR